MKLETLNSFVYHDIIEKPKSRRQTKKEAIDMGVIKYIGRLLREMRAADEEYARAYRRCFEGTPEEVARRLEA